MIGHYGRSWQAACAALFCELVEFVAVPPQVSAVAVDGDSALLVPATEGAGGDPVELGGVGCADPGVHGCRSAPTTACLSSCASFQSEV